MSLLLDALKRAELAKRQQAAGVEPEVYPSLALQGDEVAHNVAAQGPPDESSANADAAPESAFAAGLALEPVERAADVAPATEPELSLPERVSAATAAPVAPMPFASETAEPPIAITREPENTETASPASEPVHEPEGEPPVLLAAVVASPAALAAKPAPSSPLASRFGAAAKPAVEVPAPEVASAPAPGTPPVGSIPPAAAVAATPEAAKRVMINQPARKPINRAVWLALGGVLLLAASAGYVWWQMQPPSFNPDPALASDPLAASMADAGATGNAAAAAPAVTAAAASVAATSSTSTVGKVASASPGKPAAAVNPVAETALPMVNRPSKRLEIRHDAPEEVVDETVQAAYKAYQSGDLASARAAYVRALQANPRERDALLGMAAIAARQGRSDEAERLYRKQLDYDPLDEVAKAGLTGISKGMGTREREAALRNLGDQPASSAQTAVQLGNLYAAEKRWNEAQQQYFRALTLEPASPDHAFNLAISLEHLDQPRLALEYYQKAQTLAAQRKPGFDPAELKTRIEALSQP